MFILIQNIIKLIITTVITSINLTVMIDVNAINIYVLEALRMTSVELNFYLR